MTDLKVWLNNLNAVSKENGKFQPRVEEFCKLVDAHEEAHELTFTDKPNNLDERLARRTLKLVPKSPDTPELWNGMLSIEIWV